MTPKLELKRFESGNQGTFGVLIVPNRGFLEFFFTGELPDRNNQSNISCIPIGTYTCKKTYSPHFKRETYELSGVRGRGSIRIHSANFMGDVALGYRSQLNGCIALGERLGFIDNQRAVLLSVPAIRRFEAMMNNEPFELEVKD